MHTVMNFLFKFVCLVICVLGGKRQKISDGEIVDIDKRRKRWGIQE